MYISQSTVTKINPSMGMILVKNQLKGLRRNYKNNLFFYTFFHSLQYVSVPMIHSQEYRGVLSTHTCAYQGLRNVCFSENLARFVFVKHPFALLSMYYIITTFFFYKYDTIGKPLAIGMHLKN